MQEALDLAGKDDPELQDYVNDIKSVLCGSGYMKPRENKLVTKSTESEPHEQIQPDVEDPTAGMIENSKKPAKIARNKVERFSPENWTHMDYTREFGPYTDLVPGKLSWKPLKELKG